MTENDIKNILHELFVIHINEDPFSRIDFFKGEDKLGYISIFPKETKGIKKPIVQKVYLVHKVDMIKVIDYINERIPIQEGDFDIINKTIYDYCVELVKRYQ